MTEQPEGLTLRLAITTSNEWIVEKVVATEDDPACIVTIAVNPDAAGSMAQFSAVTSIFTDEFMQVAHKSMQDFIRSLGMEPDEFEQVASEVREAMVEQGLSEEEADAIVADAGRALMPEGGDAPEAEVV